MRSGIRFSECRRVSKIILIVPIVLFLFSTLFFVSQSGFGGGHSSFDLLVFISAIPAYPLIVLMERTRLGTNSDFINLLVLPFLWNLGIALVIVRVIERKWVDLKLWAS
jgi:hypothetical protein